MPHNMTPPLGLPDRIETDCPGLDRPAEGKAPLALPHRRRAAIRKTPPVEDVALLLVVIGFVAWSVAFAYHMSI